MSLPPLDVIADAERIIKTAQQNFGTVALNDINDDDAVTGIYTSWLKDIMLEYKLIVKRASNSGYILTERGRQFKSFADEDEHVANVKKKLSIDLKNAERIYKGYPLTRTFAWIGAISGTLLLILRLIEWYKQ